MPSPIPSTWYAGRSRAEALAILALLLGALAWGLSAAHAPPANPGDTESGGKDLELYRAIVSRVHDGESYYDAAGSELRAGGYATGSVFNWRTPTYAWLIGKLPSPGWGQALLIAGALATLLLAYGVLYSALGAWPAAIGVMMLSGPFLWCVDGDAFFVQELWGGMLIALSACAYGCGKWPAGFAAGLFALFFRELTLPYCLICAFLASREGRRREVTAWLVGFAAYACFWAFHAMRVIHHMTPGARLPASWLQFGGMQFLLVTCRMNAYLYSLPAWISAIYLPLCLVGLVGWRQGIGPRFAITAVAYLAAFTIVGQPFNDYWGLLYAPLLPFGLVWAPFALRDLLAAALSPIPAPAPAA